MLEGKNKAMKTKATYYSMKKITLRHCNVWSQLVASRRWLSRIDFLQSRCAAEWRCNHFLGGKGVVYFFTMAAAKYSTWDGIGELASSQEFVLAFHKNEGSGHLLAARSSRRSHAWDGVALDNVSWQTPPGICLERRREYHTFRIHGTKP